MSETVTRQKIVDSAEPEVIRTRLIELGWEQRRLFSGDFMFLSYDFLKVGITRKTVQDLMNSIGEVFSKQLEGMLDYYDIKIILLEGSWRKVKDNVFTTRGISFCTWDMVWNYLRRWQDKGFTLELTTNEGHTINRLNKLYALYQKPFSLSARSRKWADDRVLALPSGVRGKTGEKILETRSLREVALMSVEELVSLDGIGQRKAELIHSHFEKGGKP